QNPDVLNGQIKKTDQVVLIVVEHPVLKIPALPVLSIPEEVITDGMIGIQMTDVIVGLSLIEIANISLMTPEAIVVNPVLMMGENNPPVRNGLFVQAGIRMRLLLMKIQIVDLHLTVAVNM
ncbi:MAG: hypothetical protein MI749_06320, partial [Desulfovibrionales bacterium]|nr:hypothetical protein [Desulfovibrionales bacterium]